MVGDKIPSNIRIADYKQLTTGLAAQRHKRNQPPKKRFDLYERNWRHVDLKAMDREKKLLDTLLSAFRRRRLLV
ncbi:MAG: hypothetical protein IPK68_23535 [Bdellovibrionales bacterium]|nr:hypothetical protein [Bdellovibrionales bacterium]